MKSIFFFICSILFFTNTGISQINSSTTAFYLTQSQQDDIYQSIMLRNNLAHKDWNETFPLRKKNIINKSIIWGGVIGGLIGVATAGTIGSACELTTWSIAVLTGEDQCNPKPLKAVIIGGIVGIGFGVTVGIHKSKRLKFTPKIF